MTSTAIIRKTPRDWRVTPNFSDYEGERRRFDWHAAAGNLNGPAGFNIGWATPDRWLETEQAGKVAFRFLTSGQPPKEMTYAELARQTNRFANVLRQLGCAPGSVVFVLAERIPELYVSVLGSLKCGCVVSPLFSAFGPEPIATRIDLGAGRVLVTTTDSHLARAIGEALEHAHKGELEFQYSEADDLLRMFWQR